MQLQPIQDTQPIPKVSGATIFVMPDPQQEEPPFPKNPARVLSLVQIIMGYVSLHNIFDYVDGIGEGTYCGLYFIIAGVVGLITSSKPTTCKISAFMTFSILATIYSFNQIIICSLKLSQVNNYQYGYGYRYRGESPPYQKPISAMLSIMILAGFTEMVVSIICSAICCSVICRKASSMLPHAGGVVHLEEGAQIPGVAPGKMAGGVPHPIRMACPPEVPTGV